MVLFDAASFDEDVDNYIIPMLDELYIFEKYIKYIFISHNHRDHACIESIMLMKKFLSENPNLGDEEIRLIYNKSSDIPPIITRLIAVTREAMKEGKI